MRSRNGWLVALSAASAILVADVIAALGTADPSSRPANPAVTIALRAPPHTPLLRIRGTGVGRPVAPGFIGLSIEFPALPAYAGTDPAAVDPVFEQLIRNLAPRQRPVLRIGGDSTDRSWVGVPGLRQPAGVTYTLGASWLRSAGALARDLNARLIVGVNLEADSATLAGAEARALLAAVGRGSLQAFELGNEPELYGTFPWFRAAGRGVPGRPRGWDIPAYIKDLGRITPSLPNVPLAAPATGATEWMRRLGQMASAQPRVAIATVHRYPLHRCFTSTASPQYPTIPHLLTSASSAGLAASVVSFVSVAHAHGLSARIDEFNTVSCSGKRGVSDTFASALWALDASFQMARVGADGVSVHTFPGGIYQPFRLRQVQGSWRAGVRPEYYGLMMFAQAAPAGSRLLRISGSSGAGLRTWATRAPDGQIHVVLINESLHRPRYAALRIPGRSRPAALERLQAPSVAAQAGVTLGGRSFGTQTRTGRLAGSARRYVVVPVAGEYVLRLPASSAAMLTLAPSG